MNKKVLVIGYGVSGRAAAGLLQRQGIDVIAVDKKPELGVLPDTANVSFEEIGQVVLSPGVPSTHPLVQKALQRGIEVIGEIELGFRQIKNRCFGITAANGKTTTVLLTTHILNSAGKKARALGNVGDPISAYVPDPEEILIVELSSFQLESLTSRCLDVGMVLNLTPNHLDRYGTMQAYVAAKARIRNCIKEGGALFISRQVEVEFGPFFPGAENFEKEVDLINGLSYTKLGMPSKQSVQAALLLCKRCGVTDADFLRGLETFQKPPHRIEWVAEIDGVSYYNDSKASNVQAVMHAVERLEGPIVLIVGGLHKGSSYLPWIAFRGKVQQIIAYGQAAPLMELELASALPFRKVDRFAEAVQEAKIEAKEGDTVLLSPGCSSYDQFPSFEHRGEEFKRLVRGL